MDWKEKIGNRKPARSLHVMRIRYPSTVWCRSGEFEHSIVVEKVYAIVEDGERFLFVICPVHLEPILVRERKIVTS